MRWSGVRPSAASWCACATSEGDSALPDAVSGGLPGLVELAPLGPRPRRRVDVACLRAQRTDRRVLAVDVLERVVVEVPARVLPRDLVDVLVGRTGAFELRQHHLGRV